MKNNYKMPGKEQILAAFSGGVVLSILELASALQMKENIVDVYFLSGMFMAGIIGIFGVFLSQTNDIGGAITSGIAAPQLLGGFLKVGNSVTTAAATFIAPFLMTAYADTDSITIASIVTGTEKRIEFKTTKGEKIALVDSDTTYFKIPKLDSIIIEGEFSQNKTIAMPLRDTVYISVSFESNNSKAKHQLLRGIFAKQVVNKSKPDQTLRVKVK